MTELEDFISTQLELLSIEKEAEVEETRKCYENISSKELQKRGVCLLQLRIGSCATGLFNRTVITFESFWPGKQLPSHKLTSGDIVGVTLQYDEKNLISSGIVLKTSTKSISVAFEESLERLGMNDSTQYQIIKLANDVTYRRLKSALKDLRQYHSDRASNLISVLFGKKQPSDPLSLGVEDLSFVNQALDSSQREAVAFALSQREIAIIHGPPGTGKTTTLIEIILQATKQGGKILVCAPSNIAVDNLVERLSFEKVSMVRLGHPARLLGSIQKYSLDALVTSSDAGSLMNDIRKELDSYLNNTNSSKKEKRKLNPEIHALRKELRNRETKATKELLERSSVVLSTLTSAYEDGPLRHLNQDHFDMLIIDECSQAIEAACWIPMLKVPKCIIAGDHYQLPPTIVSDKAAKRGLEISLMERLFNTYGETITKLLIVQYRMHDDILQWSSNHFYKGKLISHSSVANHLLRDLQTVESNEQTGIPLLLIDTAGCDLHELETSEEDSKGNEGEADVVAHHIQQLIQSGVKQKDIAVITPYNLQVELLRLRIHSKFSEIEIKSVDGFQGREKEAVVISLVRSNSKREIGFLSELRRINVAVTRARRHLAVICDSDTVSSNAELKSFIDYVCMAGEVRSAEQYNSVINQGPLPRPLSVQKQVSKEKVGIGKASRAKPKPKKNKDNKKNEALKSKDSDNTKDEKENIPSKDNIVYERINEQIQEFIKDPALISYSFPAVLTSYERRIVHEIAEKENLLHSSHGEGNERHIIISKLCNKNLNSQGPQSEDVSLVKDEETVLVSNNDCLTNNKPEDHPIHEETQETTTYVKCSGCQKSMPEKNILLHEMHCQTIEKPKQVKKNCNGNKMSSVKKVKNTEDLPDDFDELMASVAKENRTCHFQKCKTSTMTLGQLCEFCRKKFCLSHSLPEIHGCGLEARKHARQTMLKESTKVVKEKLNPIHRIHLQRKLEKKLSEMAGDRKPKKKNSDAK